MNEIHRQKLSKDFRFIIGLIGICSLVGFGEIFFPILDLFNHFRLQAIVCAFFCFIFHLVLKDKRAAVFAITVLVFNLGIVGFKLYQTGGIPALAAGQTASLSVISSNVLTSNNDYDAVISLMREQDADVLIFSEVDQIWVGHLSVLEDTYPYFLKHPRPDNFGMLALSKRPFEGEVRPLGDAQLPLFILKFDGLTIFGAHPLPPASARNMHENRAYLSEMAKLAGEQPGAVLIAGDLNATLWSAAIAPLTDAGLSRINPLGLAYTWPKNNPTVALQIDHFFGKKIPAADFKVLPSVGSDHYPIRADIVLEAQN